MGVNAILKVDSSTISGIKKNTEVNKFIRDFILPNYFTKIVNNFSPIYLDKSKIVLIFIYK